MGTLNTGMPPEEAPHRDTRPSSRSPTSPFQQVHDELDEVHSAYKTTERAFKVLDHIRRELDHLMEMGDVVRPEDVIQSAGRLVGHGLGAENLAQLLADMPITGGQGLASWIRMHDLTITQAEMKLGQEAQLLQQRLGVASIRSIAATQMEHDMGQGPTKQQGPEQEVEPGPGAEPGSMNALSPGGGGGLQRVEPQGSGPPGAGLDMSDLGPNTNAMGGGGG